MSIGSIGSTTSVAATPQGLLQHDRARLAQHVQRKAAAVAVQADQAKVTKDLQAVAKPTSNDPQAVKAGNKVDVYL